MKYAFPQEEAKLLSSATTSTYTLKTGGKKKNTQFNNKHSICHIINDTYSSFMQ